MIGHTAPGSRISLDGKAVRQRSDGRFLIGFGRDAKASALLRVRIKGGGTITRTLFVGLAMIESTAIYCFVVAMILLFATPFWDHVLGAARG